MDQKRADSHLGHQTGLPPKRGSLGCKGVPLSGVKNCYRSLPSTQGMHKAEWMESGSTPVGCFKVSLMSEAAK